MKSRFGVPALGLLLALLTVGIAVVGILLNIANRTPIDISAIAVVTFLTFPAMGLLILRYRPDNAIGYLLLWIGVTVYFSFYASDYARFAVVRHPGSLPFGEAVAWMSAWNWIPFSVLVIVLLPLLFPDGRLLSRRWWIVIVGSLIFAVLAFGGNAFTPGPANSSYPDVINPLGIRGQQALFGGLQTVAAIVGLLTLIGSLSAVVVRYRRADGVQRHQLRWFLFAVPVAMIPFVLQGNVPTIIAQAAVGVTIPLIPVAIAIAVLRYRLYDIDVVINRTLVYGLLAVFITVVYVAIVVGLGSLMGAANRASLPLSIVATAIVALAFQPVHARAQQLANRVVYGKRATPYQVLAGFATQMSGTLARDRVLPQIAEVAARGVAAIRSRVQLVLPDDSVLSSSWPDDIQSFEPSWSLPIRYVGVEIGHLEVEKARGDVLTRRDQTLLSDLAHQAGLVLHNVRLVEELQSKLDQLVAQAHELQASRQRLITAEESERRRLGEEIRSDVQCQLEAIEAQLLEVERAVDGNAEATAQRLNDLATLTQRALDSLRELARGIFPPILADKGIVPALHAQLRKIDLAVRIDVSPGLESKRFDPQVETALYFTCIEGLRRATPSTAIQLVGARDRVHFTINGLTAHGEMRESQDRIAAAGGSLRVNGAAVTGDVPLALPGPVAASVTRAGGST